MTSVASVKPLKQVKKYLDGDIKQSSSGKKNITVPLANPIEYYLYLISHNNLVCFVKLHGWHRGKKFPIECLPPRAIGTE